MSFGLGDGVALLKLIKDTKSLLKQIRKAPSDYQELCRELDNLKRALLHVDKLDEKTTDQTLLLGIKATALSARWPLENFLQKLQKYESTLGLRRTTRILPGWTKATQWTSLDDEVIKLQHHLNIHVGTVNMMLITYGLVALDTVRDQSIAQQDTLQDISRGVQAHVGQLTENKTLISQLYSVVVDTIIPSLQNLVNVTERMVQCNLDIYTLIFKMQSSIALCVSPTMWFQEPVLFEDACQRRIQISSQFQYDEVLAIIKVRFPTGQCYQTILSGQFELHNVGNNQQVCKKNWFGFQPGAYVKMAAILNVDDSERCPNSDCNSRSFKDDLNGSRICIDCHTWVGHPKRPQRSREPVKRSISEYMGSYSENEEGRGQSDEENLDNLSDFKNVLVQLQSTPPADLSYLDRGLEIQQPVSMPHNDQPMTLSNTADPTHVDVPIELDECLPQSEMKSVLPTSPPRPPRLGNVPTHIEMPSPRYSHQSSPTSPPSISKAHSSRGYYWTQQSPLPSPPNETDSQAGSLQFVPASAFVSPQLEATASRFRDPSPDGQLEPFSLSHSPVQSPIELRSPVELPSPMRSPGPVQTFDLPTNDNTRDVAQPTRLNFSMPRWVR